MYKYEGIIEYLAINPFEFSPVIIIGNSGNGKTTFLHRFCEKRKEFYMPAFGEWKKEECTKIFGIEKIRQATVDSIKNSNLSPLEALFAQYDIIIIDDFDMLAGMNTLQDALFFYFIKCNKAIIISSEIDITNLGFSSKISNFFSSGATIHLSDPDKGSKTDFLIEQLYNNGLPLMQEAVDWLTEQNFISFASIKGFIKTLKLYAADYAYTIEDCKKLAKSYLQ